MCVCKYFHVQTEPPNMSFFIAFVLKCSGKKYDISPRIPELRLSRIRSFFEISIQSNVKEISKYWSIVPMCTRIQTPIQRLIYTGIQMYAHGTRSTQFSLKQTHGCCKDIKQYNSTEKYVEWNTVRSYIYMCIYNISVLWYTYINIKERIRRRIKGGVGYRN